MQITARDLGALLHGTIVGDPEKVVSKLSKIEEADADSVSFIAHPKYEVFAGKTKAGILVVREDFEIEMTAAPTLIKVKDPYSSFSFMLDYFQEQLTQKEGIEEQSFIHKSASYGKDFYLGAFSYVGENVTIGDHVKIYPHSYIGDGVEIGNDTTIYSGVHIYRLCIIGNSCIVHSGTVIGSDGFGFAPQKDGSYKKIPQNGNVMIMDDVEIGANVTIDRATLGSTLVKRGVKIDNLVHLAHNVEVGEYTVIAAQAGISGSTKLGARCMVGGQAGFVGHISIADGVKINAQSGVSKSIKEPGNGYTASPAYDFVKALRNEALVRRLPEMEERIKQLESKIKENT